LQVELTLPLEGDAGVIQNSGPHLLVARACAEVDAKAAGSKEAEELRLEDLTQEEGTAQVGEVSMHAQLRMGEQWRAWFHSRMYISQV
jgi:hypothetical protein